MTNVYSCIPKHIDNVYVNVVFQNTTGGEILASYNETKTMPFIDKPNEYFLTVLRMDIPLNGVPLFIMPIIPNQGNPNLTPFIFSMGGLSGNVVYTPDNNHPAPIQNLPTQVISNYYYVFSFDNFISSINALLVNIATVGLSQPAPYFTFDSITQLLTLHYPLSLVTAGLTLSINAPTVNYFEGFRLFFNTTTDLFTFIVPANSSTPVPTEPMAQPEYLITQEYNAMEYWLSLRKIVLLSNKIPINPEIVPAYSSTGSQTGQFNTLPIITDFVPNIETSAQSRSVAVYNPSAQYRLIDLIKNTQLYDLDLKLMWSDKLGNLFPIFIEIGQQASVKLAFLRKDLYQHKIEDFCA
jgi:hypothetical protein